MRVLTVSRWLDFLTRLQDDIDAGTATVLNFDYAVRLIRLIADLLSSSKDGAQVNAKELHGICTAKVNPCACR